MSDQLPPPPPPPGPPAGGYPAPAPMPQQSSNAVVALVLSIASWVVCPIVLAIVALVVAGKAKAEIDASNGWVTGDGLVTAAKVVAWINIALSIVGIVIFLLFFAFAATTSVTTGS